MFFTCFFEMIGVIMQNNYMELHYYFDGREKNFIL